MGATAVAAASRRAERHIVDHLRREGATRAERAVPLDDLRLIAERRLARLLQAQAVREEADGRYWLDEPIYASYRSDRRGLVLVMLGIAVATMLGVLMTKLY